jgi:uncharacterized damage-inducible protein DinB
MKGEHMRTLLRTLLICLLAPAALRADDKPAAAPDKPTAAAPERPFNAFNKMAYGFVKSSILRSAEKMPEESYGFKPAESVRSFGQILGHVADSQNYFCSVALGEKNPAKAVEKTKTSKADLVASLKEAFAYCDRAYDGMTPAAAVETVTLFGDRALPKIDVLTANALHGVEHYGNLIVYLRMKNIVPPSSEPGMKPEPKK